MKSLPVGRFAVAVVIVLTGAAVPAAAEGVAAAPANGLRLATFDVDATPPVGSAMAYDPVKRLDEMTLRCRGIVLLGAEQPIVLCAVDWIGIANEGQDAFRAALAEAAGTTPDRVAVHTLHQHDAPGCDFTAERLIREMGIEGLWPLRRHVSPPGHPAHGRRRAPGPAPAQPVTHYGWGVAEVARGGVEPPHQGARRPGAGHALHDLQGSCAAGRTGRRDRSASVAVELLE